MRRTVILTIGVMLISAACSSSGGAAEPGASSAPGAGSSAPAVAPSAGGPAGLPSVDPSDPLANFRDKDATAVVVIGDQRYEFSGLYCVTMGGALGASSVGGDPSVNIDLPPEDWETSSEGWDPPGVRVSIDDPYAKFSADQQAGEYQPKIKPGMSQVDSYTSDGYQASGTATFVDVFDFTADPVPVKGTFEVSCPRP